MLGLIIFIFIFIIIFSFIFAIISGIIEGIKITINEFSGNSNNKYNCDGFDIIPIDEVNNLAEDHDIDSSYYEMDYDINTLWDYEMEYSNSTTVAKGIDFEIFCSNLLERNGFYDVHRIGKSGDQGVDILAEKDGVKYAIQCKNYSSKLNNTPVQEINAGRMYYNCHVGVVMTNSTFTQGAIDLASATNVLLWDVNTLQRMSNV